MKRFILWLSVMSVNARLPINAEVQQSWMSRNIALSCCKVHAAGDESDLFSVSGEGHDDTNTTKHKGEDGGNH